MSAAAEFLSFDLALPWASCQKQEQAFKDLLKKIFVPLLLIFLLVPWLPVFEVTHMPIKRTIIKIKVLLKPPVIEKKKIAKPIQPVKIAKPDKVPIKKKMAARHKNISKKADVPKKLDDQRLAAVSKQLIALRKSFDISKLQNKNVSIYSSGKAKKVTRALLGKKNAVKTSDGLQANKINMDTKGIILVEHQTTQIQSNIQANGSSANNEHHYADRKNRRDMESIRRIFEKYKGDIYVLYTKELRSNPDLSGKFLFQLLIRPDGSITDLKLISSELEIPYLEKRILAKIQAIHFGKSDAVTTAVQYKFIFLPS